MRSAWASGTLSTMVKVRLDIAITLCACLGCVQQAWWVVGAELRVGSVVEEKGKEVAAGESLEDAKSRILGEFGELICRQTYGPCRQPWRICGLGRITSSRTTQQRGDHASYAGHPAHIPVQKCTVLRARYSSTSRRSKYAFGLLLEHSTRAFQPTLVCLLLLREIQLAQSPHDTRITNGRALANSQHMWQISPCLLH